MLWLSMTLGKTNVFILDNDGSRTAVEAAGVRAGVVPAFPEPCLLFAVVAARLLPAVLAALVGFLEDEDDPRFASAMINVPKRGGRIGAEYRENLRASRAPEPAVKPRRRLRSA